MPILQTVLMSLKPMFWGNNMDTNNLPIEIDLLPADAKAFVIRLANDGHISDWGEAFDALNECAAFRAEPNPDTFDFN